MTESQKWDRVFGAVGGRVFTIGALVVAVVIFVLYVFFLPNFTDFSPSNAPINHKDLVAFLRAGDMAIAGEAVGAYDRVLFQSGLPEGNSAHLWLYPPTGLLAAAPLALLPFGAVKLAWIAAAFLAAIAIARLSGGANPLKTLALAFSPAIFSALFIFQAGAVVAAILSFALSQAARRPILAGVAFGVLTIKPQYGLMAPMFLLATRNVKTFAAATITALVLAAMSVALFGTESWSAFFASLEGSHAGLAMRPQPGGVSAAQLAIKLGGGGAAAIAAEFGAIVVSAACVALAASRLSRSGLVAVTLYASLAASPSAWIYDWALVAAALAFYAAAAPKWGVGFQIAALLLWVAALPATFGVGGETSLIAPLALFGGLFALLILLLRTPADGRNAVAGVDGGAASAA